MNTPTDQAQHAFVHGWALSSGPLTSHVRAAHHAAQHHIATCGPTSRALQEAADLGHKAGTWALIATRRDQLHTEQLGHILNAWRKLARRIDLRALIHQVRADLGIVEAIDPATRADVSRNAHPAMYAVADPAQQEWQAFTQALASGLDAAAAEGVASAVASAAAQAGVTGIDYQATYLQAVAAHMAGTTDTAARAQQAAQQIVRAATNDITRALSKAASDGSSAMQMLDAARNALGITADAANTAASLLADQVLAQRFMDGMAGWMADQGITLVDFLTDPSSNVCPICQGYEDRNPWDIGSVPTPEIHPRCRCVLAAASDTSHVDFAPYLAKPAARTSLEQWTADEIAAIAAIEQADSSDTRLAAIWTAQGFDALPQLLDTAAFNTAAAGQTVLYRGLAGEQAAAYADAFRTGEAFPGLGIYGNGTYTTTSEYTAQTYTKTSGAYIGDHPGVVMRMMLAPDAKIATFAQLDDLLYDVVLRTPGLNGAFDDLGRLASALGYDAIAVTPDVGNAEQYLVILNRGKLIVEAP